MGLLGFTTGCFSSAPGALPVDGTAPFGQAAKCLTVEEPQLVVDQVLQLVNLERAQRDLPPVVVHPRLQKVAEDYACRMVTEKFFGHRDPVTGHGPAERVIAGKYPFYAVGENLAAGPETPAEVMERWMESPSHRDIILDPNWKEIGIGVRRGGEYATYWVQEFGDPADF